MQQTCSKLSVFMRMVKIVMMNWNYNAFSVIIVKFVRIIIVKYQLLIAIHLRIELGVELGVD